MSGAGSRFVDVPADRLVAELESIGAKVVKRGGAYDWKVQGRERVFDLTVPGSRALVRIYTTLSVGGAAVRDCGEDAVRVCVGALVDGEFKPTNKSVKLLRTAPRGAEDRVGAFLDRLREALRKGYALAQRVTPCPDCARPMAIRKGKYGEFLGCVGYPSSCRGTRPLG